MKVFIGMRLLLLLLVLPIWLFSQTKTDSIANFSAKKKGFYLSAETLYLNTPLKNEEKDTVSHKPTITEKNLLFNKNKLFLKNRVDSFFSYFAYSDGNAVYFNSNNYKSENAHSDYFIKSTRWGNYYFFEEQFVNVVPNGFAGVGGSFGDFSGMNLAFGGTIIIQNMFCSFDIKQENFFCVEKQEIKRRIKQSYREIFLKYRKSKKTLTDYIQSLQEIKSIDANGVEKIIH